MITDRNHADDPADRTAAAAAADIAAALTWAGTATSGDYLVEYTATGLTSEQDPGSRCGYDDAELDQIRQVLATRDLRLVADDRGLRAVGPGRSGRIAALAAVVGDDGTGDLGIIVDHAPADATTADLVEIVREARRDAAASDE